MCMINFKDFPAAVRDVSMVISMSTSPDVECLMKRSYAYVKGVDFSAAQKDFEEAERLDIGFATSIPEHAGIAKVLSNRKFIGCKFF